MPTSHPERLQPIHVQILMRALLRAGYMKQPCRG
jgi:hypothetical protein